VSGPGGRESRAHGSELRGDGQRIRDRAGGARRLEAAGVRVIGAAPTPCCASPSASPGRMPLGEQHVEQQLVTCARSACEAARCPGAAAIRQ
jgi:hypothetical protein